MNTSGLLDILHRPSQTGALASHPLASDSALATAAQSKSKPGGLKAMLEGLEEMWDNTHYAEEFSVDNFVKKLKS